MPQFLSNFKNINFKSSFNMNVKNQGNQLSNRFFLVLEMQILELLFFGLEDANYLSFYKSVNFCNLHIYLFLWKTSHHFCLIKNHMLQVWENILIRFYTSPPLTIIIQGLASFLPTTAISQDLGKDKCFARHSKRTFIL